MTLEEDLIQFIFILDIYMISFDDAGMYIHYNCYIVYIASIVSVYTSMQGFLANNVEV